MKVLLLWHKVKKDPVMATRFLYFLLFSLLLVACKEQPASVEVQATIKGGQDKYIKYIDMAQPGLAPDSIKIDTTGNFVFKRIASQPCDYIFYFDNTDYIRLVLCPNERVILKAMLPNLVESYTVSGSDESADVSMILKRHFRAVTILDTLQLFYLKNQTNADLDKIVERLSFINDSVYKDEKAFLTSFIENNPGSVAAYIALSQKLGYNQQLFTLTNDLPYFEMVDTAMDSRYSDIAMWRMLHTYVNRGKMQLKQEKEKALTDSVINKAPEIKLPGILGDTLSLSDIKGKFILIDFWGSWCRPSRIENKKLRDIYKRYRYRGLEIFQVAIERNAADWNNSVKEDKLYWKYQVSELNYMESLTAKAYGVKSIPSNFLVNPDGVIIGRNLYGDELSKQLEAVLRPAPKVAPTNAVATDSLKANPAQGPLPKDTLSNQ